MNCSGKIILIGMPGSGKSTLGRALAEALAISFVDLDEVIVMREGRTIPELFAQEGEGYFRAAERDSLREVLKRTDDYVLATGGGTPCFFDNMEQINAAGKSCFIDVSTHVLAERLAIGNIETRPKLALHAEVLEAELTAQRKQRLPYYQRAFHTIKRDQITAEVVLDLCGKA